jgi:hypothetical protein
LSRSADRVLDFTPTPQGQLAQQVSHLRFDGILRDSMSLSDFAIAQALRNLDKSLLQRPSEPVVARDEPERVLHIPEERVIDRRQVHLLLALED